MQFLVWSQHRIFKQHIHITLNEHLKAGSYNFGSEKSKKIIMWVNFEVFGKAYCLQVELLKKILLLCTNSIYIPLTGQLFYFQWLWMAQVKHLQNFGWTVIAVSWKNKQLKQLRTTNQCKETNNKMRLIYYLKLCTLGLVICTLGLAYYFIMCMIDLY